MVLARIQRRQRAALGRAWRALDGWHVADCLPQVLAVPAQFVSPVECAIEGIQRFGQRCEALGHGGQGFRLLACPGVEGLPRERGVVGLAGALQVTAVYYRLIPSISSGYGFLGLLVTMLVDYQVLWAAPVAFLFSALNIGGIQLPIEMKLDSTLAGIVQSALVLFYLVMDSIRKNMIDPKGASAHE